MTFIVLQVSTLINVFMGFMLSFHQYKDHKSSKFLHTGPLKTFAVRRADTLCGNGVLGIFLPPPPFFFFVLES